jgi:hypothetical protein
MAKVNLVAKAAELGFEELVDGPFTFNVNQLFVKVFVKDQSGVSLLNIAAGEIPANPVLAVMANWDIAGCQNAQIICKGDVVGKKTTFVDVTMDIDPQTGLVHNGFSRAHDFPEIGGVATGVFPEYQKCKQSSMARVLKTLLSGYASSTGIVFGGIPFLGLHEKNKWGQKVVPIDRFDNLTSNNTHGFARFKLASKILDMSGKTAYEIKTSGNESALQGLESNTVITKSGLMLVDLSGGKLQSNNKTSMRG